jgi:hypothetical protein
MCTVSIAVIGCRGPTKWKAFLRRSERPRLSNPHCDENLVGRLYSKGLDPWQPNYDERATKRVDMLAPRGGCLSLLLLLLAAWLKIFV